MEFDLDTSLSTIDEVRAPLLEENRVKLLIKRDDQMDAEISGNKWRKLKYNVLQCQQNHNVGILTFGGAYSNHLVATAAACHKTGLSSVGVVRGDELTPESNATLKRCAELGMQLHFISRELYHLRNERYYHEELLTEFPNHFVVPEGGANYMGMIGCQEIVKELPDFDRIVVAQGTTTTSCGLLTALKSHQTISVVPALKGFHALDEMRQLLSRSGFDPEIIDTWLEKVSVWDGYHFGGYAKYSDELIAFVRKFRADHQIPLDPVYTGKAMFALWSEIEKGTIQDETIVFLHTGGLQGIAGWEAKNGVAYFNS